MARAKPKPKRQPQPPQPPAWRHAWVVQAYTIVFAIAFIYLPLLTAGDLQWVLDDGSTRSTVDYGGAMAAWQRAYRLYPHPRYAENMAWLCEQMNRVQAGSCRRH